MAVEGVVFTSGGVLARVTRWWVRGVLLIMFGVVGLCDSVTVITLGGCWLSSTLGVVVLIPWNISSMIFMPLQVTKEIAAKNKGFE